MKRYLAILLAILFTANVTNAQPVGEWDPFSIWKDGTSITTASIPFAEGLSVPISKLIQVGNSSTGLKAEETDYPDGPAGWTFQIFAGGDTPNLRFTADDYLTFETGGTQTDFTSGGGITIRLNDPLSIQNSTGTTYLTLDPDLSTLMVQPLGGTTVRAAGADGFVVENAGGTDIFNINVSTPAITQFARTSITKTDANAFLVETAGGTDVFKVNTTTPGVTISTLTGMLKATTGLVSVATSGVDYEAPLTFNAPLTRATNTISFDQTANFTWTGTHDFNSTITVGTDGTLGVDTSFYTVGSGKGLFWRPAASGSNPILEYQAQTGKTKHIKISATETAAVSGQSFLAADVLLNTSTIATTSALFDFDLTDSRALTSSSDAKNILDFTFNRTAFTSSIQTHVVRGALYTLQDFGSYSRASGIAASTTGTEVNITLAPTISASSGSGTYNFIGNSVLGALVGNNSFTTFNFYGSDQTFSYTKIAGTANVVGYRYAPSSISSDTEYALYAARSGIGLISDGTLDSYSGAVLRMGASADWQRFFESDNEAVENVPTGAVYDWRINAVDWLSMSPFGLTYGDGSENATSIGTATISNASPAVVTRASHGLAVGDRVFFTTTGGAPSPLHPTDLYDGTSEYYYIISAGFGADSFQISLTSGGAAINTTTAGSGTHTLWKFVPHQIIIDGAENALLEWRNNRGPSTAAGQDQWTFSVRRSNDTYFQYPGYAARFAVNTTQVTDYESPVAFSAFINASANTSELYGFWGGIYDQGGTGSSFNITAQGVGILCYNYMSGSATRTIANLIGGDFTSELGSNITGTNVIGGRFQGVVSATSATFTNAYGILVKGSGASGPTITNDYGIRIEAMSGATNTYPIFLNAAGAMNFRAGTQAIWSSAASTLDLTANTTYNFKIGANPSNGTAGTVEYTMTATKLDVSTNIMDMTAGKAEMPALTALPATCVQGEYVQDTDSDDCANTGGGDGAVCVCKTTNTWALMANI